MDYKVLYRKYRPADFNHLVGQDSIKKILVNSIDCVKLNVKEDTIWNLILEEKRLLLQEEEVA